MTAAPLNNGLAKVRKLLPVRLGSVQRPNDVMLFDKHGHTFCIVPVRFGETDTVDATARAELIRDAMNEMA